MKYKKSPDKSAGSKKYILFVLFAVAIFGLGFWLFAHKNNASRKPVIQPGSVAEISKPTEEEKQAADIQKDKNLARAQADQTTAPSPTNIKQVVPYITFIDQTNDNVEVGGIIPGIYESGGTCTLTAKNGTKQVTVQSEAQKNATTTDCRPFTIPEVQFSPKGTWSFVVSYTSSNAQGSSQSKDMNVK